MKNDNIVKGTTKVTDEYLKFIEQSFNTDNVSFLDIVKSLNDISKSKDFNKNIRDLANNLNQGLKVTPILDFDKYDKFERLGDKLGINIDDLNEVYRVSDEIVRDINKARDWLASYKSFRSAIDNKIIPEDTHKELLLLGKSILGRAIELTPIKTGLLRSSGFLLDYTSYIIIGFAAPYATYVHENLAINHPHHVSNPNCGGRAKFLELALQEFFPNQSVWVEIHGIRGVVAKIALNPLYVEYRHYN